MHTEIQTTNMPQNFQFCIFKKIITKPLVLEMRKRQALPVSESDEKSYFWDRREQFTQEKESKGTVS